MYLCDFSYKILFYFVRLKRVLAKILDKGIHLKIIELYQPRLNLLTVQFVLERRVFVHNDCPGQWFCLLKAVSWEDGYQ